jgi:hypothetical protein
MVFIVQDKPAYGLCWFIPNMQFKFGFRRTYMSSEDRQLPIKNSSSTQQGIWGFWYKYAGSHSARQL